MRISNNMLYDRFLQNLTTNLAAVQAEQEKITTGKRINRPSDDPVGAYKAMDLNNRIARQDQYGRSMVMAEGMLTSAELAFRDAENVLTRASELAILFGNGTLSSEEREYGAAELRELRDQLAGLSNQSSGGRYIFSGYRTNVPAYAETIVISTGVNDELVFDAGGGDVTVTLAAGIYTPEDLARELTTRLEAANGSPDTYTVTFDYGTDEVFIANDTGNTNPLDIKWEDAGSTAAPALGFSATDHPAIGAGSRVSGDNSVTYSRGFLVTASNNTIMADLDGTLEAVTLTANAYTASALATEIQTRLNAADDDGDTYSVAYNSSTQSFTITNDTGNSGSADFVWTHGGSTAAALLGFSSDVTLAVGAGSTSQTLAGLSAMYRYQGDGNSSSMKIADSVQLNTSMPGSQAFDDAFLALDRLVAALEGNSQTQVSQAGEDVTDSLDALLDAGATFGARLNRLEMEKTRGGENDLLLQETLSAVEDADFVEAVMRMERRQSALEALRYTGFESLSRSLFDFLR